MISRPVYVLSAWLLETSLVLTSKANVMISICMLWLSMSDRNLCNSVASKAIVMFIRRVLSACLSTETSLYSFKTNVMLSICVLSATVCLFETSLVLSSKTTVIFHICGIVHARVRRSCPVSQIFQFFFSLCQLYTSRGHAHFSFSLAFSTLCASHRFHAGMYTIFSLSLAFSVLCVSYRLHACIHILVPVGLLCVSVSTDFSGHAL